MKKLFIIPALLASTLSAMDPAPEEENVGNWAAAYQTRVGLVEHTQDQVILNRMMFSKKSISIQSKIFNGVSLPDGGFRLEHNWTQGQFEKALRDQGLL